MGEARRRQLAGEYPKYEKLETQVEKRRAGFEVHGLQIVPRIKSYLIGHGQQIARRDGRA